MAELVEIAALIAQECHEGQEHGFGDESYFEMHLKPVADIVARLGYQESFVATAYLHDVKEDSSISDAELARRGMPPKIVEAVDNLTKRSSENQAAYLDRVSGSPLSIVVKFADSSFNFSWTVLNSADKSEERFQRGCLKYATNLAFLKPLLPPPS